LKKNASIIGLLGILVLIVFFRDVLAVIIAQPTKAVMWRYKLIQAHHGMQLSHIMELIIK